jgi:ppGpp synthetase/RelA/SpoT-type nucleotidyltranferase
MNIEEYARHGERLYADLAFTVENIIRQAIAGNSLGGTAPQFQHRAKDVERVRARLAEEGLADSLEIEQHRKDLGGCRVIFYTNGDLQEFVNSGVLGENFEIDYDRTRVHHPTDPADPQFRGYNFVVRLKPDRTALPEYARFAGLACEVQLQTILNHAWSETTHDILYKRPDWTAVGKKAMDRVQEQFDKIMQEHLVPAGHAIEKAKQDFESFLKGKPIFEVGPVRAIEAASDNNICWDVLDRIIKNFLPHHDDPSPLLPDLLKTVDIAVARNIGTPAAPLKTSFGETEGFTGDMVVGRALDLLDLVRYGDPAASLDMLLRFDELASSARDKDRILQSVTHLGEVPIRAFKRTGGEIHLRLVRALQVLDPARRKRHLPIVLEVCAQVLDPVLHDVTGGYQIVTMSHAAVPANKETEVARREALALLETIYDAAGDDAGRQQAMATMAKAARTPHQGSYSNTLLAIILRDALHVLSFLQSRIAGASYEVRKEIEHDAWDTYRMLGKAGIEGNDDGSLAPLHAEIEKATLAIRDELRADGEYVIFKTLASLRSVYDPAWVDPRLDYKRDDAWRTEQVDAYFQDISDTTIDEWLARMARAASSPSIDGAAFRGLEALLRRVCLEKPELILPRLRSLDDHVKTFLPLILSCLWQTKFKEDLIPILQDWIKAGQHLVSIARQFRLASEARPDLFAAVFNAAASVPDVQAVLELVETLVTTYSAGATEQKELIVSAITWLDGQGNHNWAQAVWHLRDQLRALVHDLNAQQRKVVLRTLVPCPKVDTHVEWVLACFIQDRSPDVFDFFEARLAYAEGKDDDVERYEAVPYTMSELAPLRGQAELVLDKSLEWLKTYPRRDYDVGKLLNGIFNEIDEPLKSAMLTIVGKCDAATTLALVKLLSVFHGSPAAIDICREVVATTAEIGRPLQAALHAAITSTDTLNGHFGYVEAHRGQRALLEPWLSDPRPPVVAFAGRFIAGLERGMAAEQGRAEQEVAIEKLTWDTDEAGDDEMA